MVSAGEHQAAWATDWLRDVTKVHDAHLPVWDGFLLCFPALLLCRKSSRF